MLIGIAGGIPFNVSNSLGRQIAALFAQGEKGVHFDPSDFSTLFQDSVGTTPVTAAGQTVGLMLDKSQGLVLGPELVTNGTFDTGITGWSASLGATVAWVSGEIQVTASAINNSGATQSISNLVVGSYYKITAIVRRGTCVDVVRLGINGIGDVAVNSTTNTNAQYIFKATSTSHSVQVVVGGTLSSGMTAYADNISVKELSGYHATQPTSTARPILGRHPITGRRNLLVRTEETTVSPWAFTNVSGTATQNGNAYTFGANAIDRILQSGVSVTAGQTYTASVTLSGSGSVRLFYLDGAGATLGVLAITLSATPTRYSTTVASVTSGGSAGLGVYNNAAGTAGASFTIHNSQVEPGSTPTAYQKVVSTYDVTEAGVNDAYYLKFDGVDDFMVTPSIDFSGSDKMSVFAGVRKLSDAASGVVCELGASVDTTNNTFVVFAPYASGEFGMSGRGTVTAHARATGFAAPSTGVIAGTINFALSTVANETKVRINGATQTMVYSPASTTDMGVGPFSSNPLYIGMRAGISVPFSGHLYSLVVRGALSDASQIASGEVYCNSKTGAY